MLMRTFEIIHHDVTKLSLNISFFFVGLAPLIFKISLATYTYIFGYLVPIWFLFVSRLKSRKETKQRYQNKNINIRRK